MTAALFCQLSPDVTPSLADFFAAIVASGADRWFHPHPLTASEAASLCLYLGDDYYCVAHDGLRVVAYGMLRGWEEGYDVPSLGIAVHPDARRRCVGAAMVLHLCSIATLRGCKEVRVRVHEDNAPARALFRECCFEFDGTSEDGMLVGRGAL